MTTQDQDRFQARTGITAEDYRLLASVPLLAGLAPAAMRSLLAEAWVQSFPRNTLLFLQDEPATRFYLIFRGWVKLFRSSEEGAESVIAVFTRGESFAEAATFDGGVYPVSAAIVEDSRLLVVPAEPFLRRLSQDGELALKALASLSRHLRRLVRQVEQLTLRSSTERVAGFLVRLCPIAEGSAVVHLPLDKALIAGRLGMQPETFSRSLAKLRHLGVISKGAEVAIADVAQLRRLGEGRQTRLVRQG
jgi:CRP-like cAMP-binding protein